MSSYERSGWRDEKLSLRHRLYYGRDCPMVDIDWMVFEYDHCQTVILIDFKHEDRERIEFNDANARCQINAANKLEVPFFIVRYGRDITWYEPYPMNQRARDIWYCGFTKPMVDGQRITEIEFVWFIYHLRNRTVPQEVLDNIITSRQGPSERQVT